MSDISKSMALEIADNWDQMAATAEPASRRETLRECADTIRMLANRTTPDCPFATPHRYCQTCVVSPCPIGLGGKL